MAKDFAKKTSSKRPGAPGWAYLVVGLAVGLFVAFLVYLKEHRDERPTLAPRVQKSLPAQKPRPANKAADERPRFDFFTILPDLEVLLPERPTATEREARPEGKSAQYVLQVGSFRSSAQADALRASLALLGVEAQVQSVTVNGSETWHRVRVGPAGARRIDAIQNRLERENIRSLVMRIKD